LALWDEERYSKRKIEEFKKKDRYNMERFGEMEE
jgi:hypothetical protein